MAHNQKVLIVEDDPGISRFLSTILSANQFDVITAKTGQEAWSLLTSHCPDLLLLDLGLPDMDGMKLITDVRGWSQMPIVVISARSHESDKVRALDAGADDYLTKPFGTSELLARIRTAIRHTGANIQGVSRKSGQLTVGGMVIDYDKRRVFVDGEDVRLTQNEYKIVALLGRHAGKVMTYDSIIRELWGPSAGGNNQILRVNMANIRRKIEKNPGTPEYIFTEVGVGYRMLDCD